MEVANELMVRGIVVGVFQENCWIIGNRRTGEAICIDPGDEPEEILALARDMGVRIKYIANSHAHVDHVMGVAGVHAATGAKFLLHHADLDLLRHGWKAIAARFGIPIEKGPPDPDAFVTHGDIVEVDGLRLRTIATPGHTPGSVSYYAEEGMLFSGDTLFRGSIGRTDLPGGNFDQEMRSICERLLLLPDDTIVLPGHMQETTIGFEKQHNPFVLEWLRAAARIPPPAGSSNNRVTATLTFHGGTGTVTGSRFLLATPDDAVLVDCGLFQGLKALRLQNWQGPGFHPRTPRAILLTHAHIDHTGYLPRLVRLGYRGPIYATPATAELTRILLLDAAQIQEEDAAFANRKGFSKHQPALPLFTVGDALRTIQYLRTRPYGERFDAGTFRATFRNAGHILGSAFVHLEVPLRPDHAHRIVISGDLGRYHQPIHTDPVPLPPCDTLVLETTYGDRTHSHESIIAQLRQELLPTLERGGTVLIPAFAVARAQLVTHHLRVAIETGRFPDIPIHIDSPMANDVTDLYDRYLESEYLDRAIPHTSPGALFPRNVRFHRTIEDSKTLNNLPGPRIIIAASGMLTGGRALHHLQRLAPDPRNLICLVGYQAAGTRGRALIDGATTLRVFGIDIDIRARVTCIHGLSAHADRDELLRWVESAHQPPKRIFLVHGEPPAAEALAAALRTRVPSEIVIPALGQSFPLE